MSTENRLHSLKKFQYYLDEFKEFRHLEDTENPTVNQKSLLKACNLIPASFREKYMSDITQEEIIGVFNYASRFGRRTPPYVMTVMRYCFHRANIEDEISSNPMDEIHLKSAYTRQNPAHPLNETDFHHVLEAVYSVPGGKAYGLAAFLNLPMKYIGDIYYENCDPDHNTIHITTASGARDIVLTDENSIQLFHSVLEDYTSKMSNPGTAQKNSCGRLLITQPGDPYTQKQLDWISIAVRDRSGVDGLRFGTLRKYIRTRLL